MNKKECKCGKIDNNRNCPYHFPITSKPLIPSKNPIEEKEHCLTCQVMNDGICRCPADNMKGTGQIQSYQEEIPKKGTNLGVIDVIPPTVGYMQEEREMWDKNLEKINDIGLLLFIDSLYTYLISRIQARVQEAKQDKAFESVDYIKSLVEQGRQEERLRIIAIVEGIKVSHPYCVDGCTKDDAICSVLASNSICDDIINAIKEK